MSNKIYIEEMGWFMDRVLHTRGVTYCLGMTRKRTKCLPRRMRCRLPCLVLVVVFFFSGSYWAALEEGGGGSGYRRRRCKQYCLVRSADVTTLLHILHFNRSGQLMCRPLAVSCSTVWLSVFVLYRDEDDAWKIKRAAFICTLVG